MTTRFMQVEWIVRTWGAAVPRLYGCASNCEDGGERGRTEARPYRTKIMRRVGLFGAECVDGVDGGGAA